MARTAEGVSRLVCEESGGKLLRPMAVEGGLRGLIGADLDPRDCIDLNVAAIPARKSPDVLTSPLTPGKIVAIGLNYADHVREANLEAPREPLVFAKFCSSIAGPYDEVILPSSAERVDWEVELGVVIGRRARAVAPSDALDYVFGYTVANDVSARDVQFGDGQWVRGKSFDTFCPIGPFVVTRDEVSDPQGLVLRTRVNGETVQESSTSEMLFGVRELVAYCSRNFTLDPGDLLLTGTPWGCGEFRYPRRWLATGDLLETEIEGIGVLRNPVRAAVAAEADVTATTGSEVL